MFDASRILLIVAALCGLAGCRLAVAVGSGGSVDSLSGARDCFEGSHCLFQPDSSLLDEVFTAVSLPGFEFVQWQPGEGHVCGGSTDPDCSIARSSLARQVAEADLAAAKDFLLQPEFRPVDGVLGETSKDYVGRVSYWQLATACSSDYGQGATVCTAGELLSWPDLPSLISGGAAWILPAAEREEQDPTACAASQQRVAIGRNGEVTRYGCDHAMPAACCR